MYYNYQTQKTLFDHISETQRGERMKDANAAITLPEKWPEKIQALNGIRTNNLCVTGAMLYQLSYQSHVHEHEYDAQRSIFDDFEEFGKVAKHYLECLIYLLNQNRN